jgi:sugar transferase (PEP-CTERM/EpsH1 system associated)
MAQYLPADVPCRIADFVDVDSAKWRQFAEDSRGFLRAAYAHEAARLRAFEARAGTLADRVLFVSNSEADLFRSFAAPGPEISVVPMGVDTSYFAAAPHLGGADAATLLFTGSLDYRPNVDAVRLCAEAILPRVRREVASARLLAVGHRPAAAARAAARRSDGALEVIGSVPDMRPYFRSADVYLAPLRLGRGVQNKILEAMAMCVPVVASPLAVAGIEVEHARDVLIGETPEELAAHVVALLRDPVRRFDLSTRARARIRARYEWDDNLRLVDGCLQRGAAPAGAARRAPVTGYPASPPASERPA